MSAHYAALIALALTLLLVAGQGHAQEIPLLTCPPGETITIAGTGQPHAGLLLFFNGRAVGGGVVDASGAYRMPLQVGNERPGAYPVVVEVRESREAIQRMTCTVPGSTPSPDRDRSSTSTPGATPMQTATRSPVVPSVPTSTRLPTATPVPMPTFSTDPMACAQEYPDFCIPPPPPTLNCRDIPYTNFTVHEPDRHKFDGNNNGVGCEGD